MSGLFGRWIVGAELRPWRIWLQKILIVAALLSFGASLPLPALRYIQEPQMVPVPVFGWMCLVFSRAHYPSNLLLFAAPLLCWMLRQCRRPHAPLVVVGLTAASLWAVFHSAPLASFSDGRFARTPPIFDIGFQVWVAAHVMMGVALVIPTWGSDPERASAKAELDRLQSKWSSPTTAA